MQSRARTLFFVLTLAVTVSGVVPACSDASTSRPQRALDAAVATDDAEAGAPARDAESDASDGTCALPGSFGSAKCDACTAEKCCEPLAACEANATCKPLLACILGCSDEPDAGACVRACMDAQPDGVSLYRQLETCVFFSDACGFECESSGK